jgi:hypothetical protein
MVYKCGQKPGIGRYVCLNCGEDLHLDDVTDPYRNVQIVRNVCLKKLSLKFRKLSNPVI